MRTLYHFRYSPYSRRTRLALAHKGLDCELREARENPAWLDEARKLNPLKTFPVLVDGERAIGDSGAIVHWLDRAYPSVTPLWPAGDDAFVAFQVANLVDVALGHVIDVGTRYYPLRGDAAWNGVKTEMLGRAQRALDGLAELSRGRRTIAAGGWSAADIWLYTAVVWIENMPKRAPASPNITQILSLGGWTLPRALSAWADDHRGRPDVAALAAG
jgi:glutathione S-transferase